MTEKHNEPNIARFQLKEEAEEARAKAVTEDIEFAVGRRAQMTETVESLIAFLQLNKEHIGGFIFAAVAVEGTPLVEEPGGVPELTAQDVRAAGLTRLYSDSVRYRLEHDLKRMDESAERQRSMMAIPMQLTDLFGGLCDGHAPSDED